MCERKGEDGNKRLASIGQHSIWSFQIMSWKRGKFLCQLTVSHPKGQSHVQSCNTKKRYQSSLHEIPNRKWWCHLWTPQNQRYWALMFLDITWCLLLSMLHLCHSNKCNVYSKFILLQSVTISHWRLFILRLKRFPKSKVLRFAIHTGMRSWCLVVHDRKGLVLKRTHQTIGWISNRSCVLWSFLWCEFLGLLEKETDYLNSY